jgi:UDP-N-acetylmuramoyl-L-alanyl-D-glutamate--2,6-diaminopimelate ligase
MIGVTGTDGKTTTINLLYRILRAAGLKVGMISTVNAVIGDVEHETGLHVTTPDAPQVQQLLAQMVAAGTTHALLETTSHGLAQHRVTACEFDIGVVTNVTHEHLDYHGDWESYRAAKGRLIESLISAARKPGLPKLAVLNADDASYTYFLDASPDRVLSFGLTAQADVTASDIVHTPSATHLTLRARLPGNVRADQQPVEMTVPVNTSLIGTYNIYNVLAAATAAVGLGLPSDSIQKGISALPQISGRMERISDDKDSIFAIVDFAHTPNALRQALETAQRLTGENGRVITVWGSAGLRDRGKRRLMGTVSAQYADITIITAEDPRTESLESIMAESAAACKAEGCEEGVDLWRVPDRGQALRFAVELARPGDVVIACGKGHEQSMCFGTTEHPWDDREALRLALLGKTLDTLPTSGIQRPDVTHANIQ